jgi:hypothetical protein
MSYSFLVKVSLVPIEGGDKGWKLGTATSYRYTKGLLKYDKALDRGARHAPQQLLKV